MRRRALIGASASLAAIALLIGATGAQSTMAVDATSATSTSSSPAGKALSYARPAGDVLLPRDDVAQRPMTEEEIMALDEESARTGVPVWWVAFAMAVDKLRAEYPEDFSAWGVNPDQRSGTVWFVGAVPEGVSDRFAGIGGVTLRGDYGVKEIVYQQFASDLHRELTEHLGSLATFSTYADDDRRAIVVEYGRSVAGAPVTKRTASLIEQATGALALPTGFAVEYVPMDVSLIAAPELLHGARVIADVCTGAFPVKRKGGNELGILTAGHCPGTGSYDGTPDAFHSPYPYSISTESGPGGGDFRWNHSKYGLSGLTFVGHGRPLAVFNSRAGVTSGVHVCGYGKTTDRKCGNVAACDVNTTATVPDNGVTYIVGGLCRMQAAMTAPGDSGGPWFVGSTAVGVHHGRAWPGGPSAFSLVNNALWKTRVNLVIDAAGNTIP